MWNEETNLTLKHHMIIGAALALFILIPFIPLAAQPSQVSSVLGGSSEIAQSYSWTVFDENMNVTTFASPDGSRDELWHFLNSAKDSIYVEIYGINNPYLLDLIHEIHDTKPSLEMKFLIGADSFGYTQENNYVANNLTLLGYTVKWTSGTDFTYAHQKFVIIDNKTTIVHSGNWAKTSFPEDGKKANREWSIAMTSTSVTAYYRSVFDGDWHNGTLYNAGTDGTGDPLVYTEASSTYPRPFAQAGTFSGDMQVIPVFSPDTSLEGILYCINNAQATLDIQIPYFTNVGDGGSVDTIINAILAAHSRGVTVRVITQDTYDYAQAESIFIQHNIPVALQDTRWFTEEHNKGIIVDGRIVLVSSINYSDGSIEENREAGVIIQNAAVAQWYQQVYDFDWGMADFDAMDSVNVYWKPNIPPSTSEINVTVFAHMLNRSANVDDVELDVRINEGSWTNTSIIDNKYLSVEAYNESYFHVIAPQADMTNITVVGRILVGSTWHTGVPMVIRVRNSIAPPITTTTTTTTETTPTTATGATTIDPLAQFLADFGIWIAVIVIAAVCGGGGTVAYKKGMLTGTSKKSTTKTKKSRKSK
jgi:phosphatidylserine/phosphatidylglycerophosphate/cardiolipin synthase-like enzyme